MKRTLQQKLAILSDAAKYDPSCASSGTTRRDSTRGGIGSAGGSGICHAYTPDGRCISLLKILMTNFCIYDCAYCINRVSSGVERARFTPEEVVLLTLEFYRRNMIEGLFLSSGIIRSPDDTMQDMVRIARMLRRDHGFKGYIHLKTIPDAAPALVAEAGLVARRADRPCRPARPVSAGARAIVAVLGLPGWSWRTGCSRWPCPDMAALTPFATRRDSTLAPQQRKISTA